MKSKAEVKAEVRRVKVEVKQWHISWGQPMEADSCPIALALKSKVGDAPCVDEYSAHFHDKDGKRWMATMPVKTSYFVERFDDYAKVKPISFWLKFKQEDAGPYDEEDGF